MTDGECREWIAVSREEYVRERIRSGESEDVARRLSNAQHNQLFPDGLPGPGNRLLAVERDGAPIGMVWVGPHPQRSERAESVWLYNIEINADARGHGAGKEALRLLEQQLVAEGHSELALNVFGHNTAARSLYVSSGYREAAITMTKSLGT